MDITKLSNEGLLSLYDAITRALEYDDAQPSDATRKYGVRRFEDWRQWGDTLEEEIRRRKLNFRAILW